MASKVSDVMTRNPHTFEATATVVEAARTMRDEDIGSVIVCERGKVRGIVTDRDIVVRAVADGQPPQQLHLSDICSSELVTVAPDSPIEQAVQMMREKALRRLPVVEGNRPVGIVSIGDLAIERDSQSALADISAAPANV